MSSEQRKLERFELELPAKVMVVEKHSPEMDADSLEVMTRDVCSGGAFFHADPPLPEGTAVKIDLVLSVDKLKQLTGKHALIKLKGRVIRTENGGMAVQFDPNSKISSLG